MQYIAKGFVASALLVTIIVYFVYFHGQNTLSKVFYAYHAKNSLSTIVLVAATLTAVYLDDLNKLLKGMVIVLFCAFIFLLRARATIVSAAFLYFAVIFWGTKKPQLKIFLLLFSLGAILFVFFNDHMHNLIINKILLVGRADADLLSITSGRSEHIVNALESFSQHPFIGVGQTHIESFPFSIIANFGIFGSVLISLLAFYPIYIAVKYRKEKQNKKLQSFIIAMIIILYSNGIFEEQPPFGPGVKCYMLWFATGFYTGTMHKSEFEKENSLSFLKS